MIVISERQELIDWYRRRGYKPAGTQTPFIANPEFGVPIKPLYTVELAKNISVSPEN